MKIETTNELINAYKSIYSIIKERCIEHIKILIYNNNNKDITWDSNKIKEYISIDINIPYKQSFEIYRIGIREEGVCVYFRDNEDFSNNYYCKLENLDIDTLLDLYTFLKKHISELNFN